MSKLYIWQDKNDPQYYVIAESWLLRKSGEVSYNTIAHVFCDGLMEIEGFELQDYDRIGTDPVRIKLSIEIQD